MTEICVKDPVINVLLLLFSYGIKLLVKCCLNCVFRFQRISPIKLAEVDVNYKLCINCLRKSEIIISNRIFFF